MGSKFRLSSCAGSERETSDGLLVPSAVCSRTTCRKLGLASSRPFSLGAIGWVISASCCKTSDLGFGIGRLLRTLRPMTCPKALTPRSVRPHFEYSQPSQLTSPSCPGIDVGKINRALINASQIFSSTVGSGVTFPTWCSKPLYLLPKYASFSAMNRVLYLLGSNAFSFLAFLFAFGVGSLIGVLRAVG